MAYFLQQLIFDCPDDASGVYSALRGHGLLRNMFGQNDPTLDRQPFNGTGRWHTGIDKTRTPPLW